MRRSALSAAVLSVAFSTALTGAAGAAEISSKVNKVGLSCSKPIQLFYDKGDPFGPEDKPAAMHPMDDHWIDLSVAHAPTGDGREHYEVRWSLRPEVELCDTGWLKFGA